MFESIHTNEEKNIVCMCRIKRFCISVCWDDMSTGYTNNNRISLCFVLYSLFSVLTITQCPFVCARCLSCSFETYDECIRIAIFFIRHHSVCITLILKQTPASIEQERQARLCVVCVTCSWYRSSLIRKDAGLCTYKIFFFLDLYV